MDNVEGVELDAQGKCPRCGTDYGIVSLPFGVVMIGDRVRFSVELIRQIAEEPDRTSHVVTLTDIQVEDDGSKILVLQRTER